MKIKNKLIRIIGLLIAFTLLVGTVTGCIEIIDVFSNLLNRGEQEAPSDRGTGHLGAEDFDLFIDELFIDIVTSNSITLNFTLVDPSAFGIEPIEPTLGEILTIELARENWEKNRAEAEKLHSFNYYLLRPDQQVIFDILMRSYGLSYTDEFVEDHVFYLGYIRPLNGIQIQLPILLANLNFRSVEDFYTYFALLKDTQRFFSEIAEFERERARRGFFLSAANVDSVLEHLEDYLSNREDNFLILAVNNIIDEFDGFTADEKIEYKQKNLDLVLNYFLPAYEYLRDAMQELRGVGANEGGLANITGGSDWALMYLRHRTDSDMTLEEMLYALEVNLRNSQQRLSSLWSENADLMDRFFDNTLGYIPHDTPENYMRQLEEAIAEEFPPLGEVNLRIVEVHENLQEHVSPAFFISPPFDDFKNNVIYTNPSKIHDNFFLFTILGHEGFPGHMYQFVFFREQSPHPIRGFITGIGYTEGWATYAEYASYFMAGLDEAEAEILMLARFIDSLFMSIIDLNVNAFGWDMNQLANFLAGIGITDSEFTENIFNRVTGVPLFSLPYTIGYIEMAALREKAELRLGDDFVPMEFNRFILEFGPAPFSLINYHLTNWIAEQ